MSTPAPSNGPGRDGSHPVGGKPARKRPWWILALLAAIAVVALVLLLSRCGSDSNSSGDAAASGDAAGSSAPTSTARSTTPGPAAPAPTTPATAAPVTSPPSTAGTPAPAPPASGAAGPGAAASGTVSAGGAALLPLSAVAAPDGTLTKLAGQPVQAAGIVVQSAPVNNGFWIGTSTADRIWVQLLEEGLVSPHPVRAGDHVSFTGAMVANPAGFAGSAGATGDDAAQLTAQGAHIEAAKSSIAFTA